MLYCRWFEGTVVIVFFEPTIVLPLMRWVYFKWLCKHLEVN